MLPHHSSRTDRSEVSCKILLHKCAGRCMSRNAAKILYHYVHARSNRGRRGVVFAGRIRPDSQRLVVHRPNQYPIAYGIFSRLVTSPCRGVSLRGGQLIPMPPPNLGLQLQLALVSFVSTVHCSGWSVPEVQHGCAEDGNLR